MATRTAALVYDSSTVANYKAFGKAITDALLAFGWVKTPDTGQVADDWSDVTTLPGATYRDNMIFGMGDTLQESNPVVVKFEFAQYGSNGLNVRVTVGSGTNGSGTVTGLMTGGFNALPLVADNLGSLGAANTFACYFSGATNRFSMLLWQSAGTVDSRCPTMFNIERSHDGSGADTDEYVTAMASNCNSSDWRPRQQSMLKSSVGGVTPFEGRLIGFVPTSGAFNSTVPMCPIFPVVGKVGNPCIGLAVVPKTDVAEGAQVTGVVYGVSHTYVACKASPNNSGLGNAVNQGSNTTATLIRFD